MNTIEPEQQATRVLFAEPDTFARVGGGETVAANITRSRSEWHFVNATRAPSPGHSPFANLEIVALQARIHGAAAWHTAERAGRWHRYDYEDAINAINLAWTFRGQSFDVVDTPDYVGYGRFLPAACDLFNVRVARFVQSLHGRLSTTYEYEWFKVGTGRNEYDLAKRRAEDLSLNTADVRYGLSEFYRRELGHRSTLPIEMIDPLLCIEVPDRASLPTFEPTAQPQLAFAGRLERRKAGDRFIDLLWYLGDDVGARRLLIGSEVQLGGVSGRRRIESHQRHRHVTGVTYLPELSQAELRQQVFRQPSVVVLPTRYDTFNLTALEAVLHGCPVMLGTNCGAYEYLRSMFPGAAVVPFEENDAPGSAEALRHVVHNFAALRQATLDAVDRASLSADVESIVRAYGAPAAFEPSARAECARDFDDIWRVLSDLVDGVSVSALDDWAPSQARAEDTRLGPEAATAAAERDILEALAKTHAHFHALSGKTGAQTHSSPSPFEVMGAYAPAQDLLRTTGLSVERGGLEFLGRAAAVPSAPHWARLSEAERSRRTTELRDLMKQSPAWLRTRLTLSLADAEAAAGRDLLAAAYRFRALRWLGDDRFGLAPLVSRTLCAAGLHEEGRVVPLYAKSLVPSDAGTDVERYLRDRFDAFRAFPVPTNYDEIVDSRRAPRYRVSVIVSLYDVGRLMLERFVRMLQTLPMLARKEAEIIFIDSGSPSPQWTLLADLVGELQNDYLFVRTSARETIQSAWNRGITMARGEYIACLGTDEGLHPAALDTLAEALDRSPTIDWAMSDSVVTAVDACGVHLDDKMAYLRTGNWSEASQLFDCTYLSYVGGLYRRSVHDRFGLYDPSFGGAGDTEFKCRIHPFISTVHVPKTLGVFLDYPVERATASCRVELEDARAWYLFRTLGGVRYLFQGAEQSRIEAAFWGTLSNRRAFTPGPECDAQFALRLLQHLHEVYPQSPVLAHEPAVRSLVDAIRAVGFQADWSVDGFRRTASRLKATEATLAELARACPERAFPTQITRDAQFFAHAWVWE